MTNWADWFETPDLVGEVPAERFDNLFGGYRHARRLRRRVHAAKEAAGILAPPEKLRSGLLARTG
jgi:hypothetical protein